MGIGKVKARVRERGEGKGVRNRKCLMEIGKYGVWDRGCAQVGFG